MNLLLRKEKNIYIS